jgi:hypothetical protein
LQLELATTRCFLAAALANPGGGNPVPVLKSSVVARRPAATVHTPFVGADDVGVVLSGGNVDLDHLPFR